MKTAVIGVGGVGGYIAAHLAKRYEGITVSARGERGASIIKDGLRFSSRVEGDFVSYPEVVTDNSLLGPQDLVFMCVKNFSLEKALEEIRPAVHERTVIVPVMNGVDAGERIRKFYPEAKVIDSVIYIVSYAMPDYSIRHDNAYATMKIGSGIYTDEVQKVADYLQGAAIDAQISDDIRLDIWRKYILNCAYNVSTARYKAPIGFIKKAPKRINDYYALVKEAADVGRAMGVPLTSEHEKFVTDMFDNYADHVTSSLQRDVEKGVPTEIETFSGYLVKTAKELGIGVPVSEEYYNAMLEMGVR